MGDGAGEVELPAVMDPRTHWETIYRTKDVHEVSWFQSEARRSLDLIGRVCPDRAAPIIDVGAGASVLVDNLLEAGYRDLSVLDLSETALKISQARLGADSAKVKWMRADVLRADLDERGYAVWHDRAVFHFLTDAADRQAYVDQVRRAVRPGGHVLVATFAEDGPDHCSGLPVVRYSAKGLHSEFGTGFQLVRGEHEDHRTPGGAEQSFLYCLCRRE
jgi:2-polyprenyl-3-methyl-5-hydroxy-6-metoxy-1,4-benzoquinol methylase